MYKRAELCWEHIQVCLDEVQVAALVPKWWREKVAVPDVIEGSNTADAPQSLPYEITT
jgi:hypothetical protein